MAEQNPVMTWDHPRFPEFARALRPSVICRAPLTEADDPAPLSEAEQAILEVQMRSELGDDKYDRMAAMIWRWEEQTPSAYIEIYTHLDAILNPIPSCDEQGCGCAPRGVFPTVKAHLAVLDVEVDRSLEAMAADCRMIFKL